jgi:GWxTD domain-containing protein
MRVSKFFLLLALFSLGFNAVSSLSAPDRPKNRKSRQDSDRSPYYKKWLEEDVFYIISEEERKVFKDLKNDEERESFIEQFWMRRDPDPRTADNSFKEEHYRRIAYANQHFASGIPGWKTDRGRIYIMYGPPDQKEEHPTGGAYNRPLNEGGGTTTTFPFEKWWYRHIDGIGDDIEIEFVDPSFSGEYRMAMSPDEKDALLHVPNAGLNLAEEMGLSTKRDRPYFNPTGFNDPSNPANRYMRAKDSPFNRMEQFFNLQRPPQIKFEDLKAAVTTRITYNTLPYYVRIDYLKLSDDKILVPISIELNNQDLEFKKEMSVNRAQVNVYGIVTGLTGRIMSEFEQEISTEYMDEYFEKGKNNRSQYQKLISLPPGQRFKLDLVLKDVNSKNMGSTSLGLTVPKYEEEQLQTSTIILANSISQAPTNSDRLDQYVIGDLKVLPNVRSEYLPGQNLISYTQIYNMALDQTTMEPSLDVTFTVKSEDRIIQQFQGKPENSAQLFYGQRVVLLGRIPLTDFAAGKYTLEIQVSDNIANRRVTTSTNFTVHQPLAATTAAVH